MLKITRRTFVASALASAVAPRLLRATPDASQVSIEHKGKLIHECTVPGETRKDDVFPAHPNGIRLSRDRFLFIYATRGFRGIDEDRSIIYQVRSEGFDGPVLKEGLLAASIDDWDPLGDGKRYKRNQGAPTAFGVPKGA